MKKVTKIFRRIVLMIFVAGFILMFFLSVLLSGQGKVFIGEASNMPGSAPPAGQTLGDTVPQIGQPGPGSDVPMVALTFNDGIDDFHTEKILDKLAEYNVKATFFVIGRSIPGREDLLRRIVAEGHEIGLHSYNHPRLGDLSDQELERQFTLNQQLIIGAAGIRPTIMRSPYAFDAPSLSEAELRASQTVLEFGLTPVFADVTPKNQLELSASEIADQVIPDNDQNAIIMLHEGGDSDQDTVDAIDIFVPELQRRGYQFETVSDYGGLPSTAEVSGFERLPGLAVLWSTKIHVLFVGAVIPILLFLAPITMIRYLLSVIMAIKHDLKQRRNGPVEESGFCPGVSLIIPAYNEEIGIKRGLISLTETSYGGEIELVVVDDGSTDRTAELARTVPGVHVIQKPNGGKASALNVGIQAAQHEICVFVDGDTVFGSDTLTHLVQPLVDPRVGGVSGTPRVGNRVNVISRIQHLEYLLGCSFDRRMQEELNIILCISGAIGAFRRKALNDVGGVPEVTLAEDTDLTTSLGSAGWRLAFAHQATAYTEAPDKVRVLWKQRVRWSYGGMQVVWKHRRSPKKSSQNTIYRISAIIYMTFMNVVMTLTGPLTDIFAVIGLIQGQGIEVLYLWLATIWVQLFANSLAMALNREPISGLWYTPLQILFYRYFNFFVTIVALRSALSGQRESWNKPKRVGLNIPKARAGIA